MSKSDVQTSLRLPEELRDRLSTAAAENGHGIGEEMRQRLEASFKSEPNSDEPITEEPITEEMAAVVKYCATAVSWDILWYTDPFAFQVFKAAVNIVLDHWKPAGDPVFRPPRVSPPVTIFLHAGVPVEAVGQTIAGLAQKFAGKQA